jgi:hypothetical protein
VRMAVTSLSLMVVNCSWAHPVLVRHVTALMPQSQANS